MKTAKHGKTIADAFDEFLADQKATISTKTYGKYKTIIGLYKSYLENYWPGHDGESDKVTKTGGTYCTTFGPDEATEGFGEFLDYFMPRKVMCGKETMQAAGTVTKKLAQWLAEKGYIKDSQDAEERADKAAEDLPNASKVLDLLDAYVDETTDVRSGKVIEDHFWIARVEPGKLYLDPLMAGGGEIGPVPVPNRGDAALPSQVGHRRCDREDGARLEVCGSLERIAVTVGAELALNADPGSAGGHWLRDFDQQAAAKRLVKVELARSAERLAERLRELGVDPTQL